MAIVSAFPSSGGGGSDEIVQAYYKSATDEFYEEPAFINLITPDSDYLYVDKGENFMYRYDTTEQKYIQIEGNRGVSIIVPPTVTAGTYTYDGTAQGPTIEWVTPAMADACIITNATQVNAGTYTLTITLKNTARMVWDDFTTADKTYEYTIGKAAQIVTLSSNTVEIDEDHTSAMVTINGAQGEITLTSTDPSGTEITTSLSENVITITNVSTNTGVITVTVSVGATSNYYAAEDSEITVLKKYFPYDWLVSANIDPAPYHNLNDVLEDEISVRKLFTIHDSVDYLVTNKLLIGNTNLTTIINNDLVAKWINLRDYALDTLYADSDIADIMDTADKYFYGEWELMPQVPVMTSNTAPYGEAFASSEYSSTYAWNAFDNNNSTYWHSNKYPSSSPASLAYMFISPAVITQAKIRPFYVSSYGPYLKNYKIQGSNDNFINDIHDLYSGTFENIANPEQTVSFENNQTYTYYRILCLDSYRVDGGSYYAGMTELQFYAWQPKGNVPVMTSNTAPYGEASTNSERSGGYQAYRAFDGLYSTLWADNGVTSGQDACIIYKFTNPTKIKRAYILETINVQRFSYLYITGSNDGINYSSELCRSEKRSDGYYDLENDSFYLYYKVSFRKAVPDPINVRTVQFYGREMKVSVPKMTSNTAPYGEVSASSFPTGNEPWRAFNGEEPGSNHAGWSPPIGASFNNSYLQYSFTHKVVINRVMGAYTDTISQRTWNATFSLYGSNDADTWTLLNDNIVLTTYDTWFTFDINNSDSYRYYKLILLSSDVNIAAGYGYKFQLFGLDYTEREWDTENPRKYIYDHGLEFETIELHNSNSNATGERRQYYLYLNKTGSGNYSEFVTTNKIDLNNYTLIRYYIGDYLYKDAGSAFSHLIVSSSATNTYNSGTQATASADLGANPYSAGALNVSSINQPFYVALNVTSSGSYVFRTSATEWWLE